ncbi:MAG: calcium-translocating P-type ATPase, PMCA-type [Prevotella sp.]|jgi:Ca2+-transporting ATPase|nr:calcium-translocating P-type ATPase, PMCA-type [Prevotella sp.]
MTNFTKYNLDGLTDAQVSESRDRYGENVLTPPKKTSLWKLYLEKYNDPIIKILLVAACVSLLLAFIENDFIETIGIFIAIVLATTVGFWFERDAAKKFELLTAMNDEQLVKVRRNGMVQEIKRKEVVVGDIVLLQVGDEVPADAELLMAVNLQVDESSLTGEPLATKSADALDEGEGAYAANVLLRSSLVMNGHGEAVVVKVGDETEIGKVATKSVESTDVRTPLDTQLDKLAKMISKIGTGVAVAAFVLFLGHDILTDAIWHGTDYYGMALRVLNYFMMAVTLIVMAVPEGLPMAVTLSLALNMRRMLKSNNLVRKLHASETMGAVTVICTDKTGTLTQNRMKVKECLVKSENLGMRLYQEIAINTTAFLDGDKGVGNPTEVALLNWVKEQGADYLELRKEATVKKQIPFSTEKKYMATVFNDNDITVKGAPEIVLDMCLLGSEQRQAIDEGIRKYQNAGMRVLAIAEGDADKQNELSFVAAFAIEDPVREDVPSAVATCRNAGIEIKIVTGDNSATAIEIARQIGVWPKTGEVCDRWHITGTEFESLSDEEAFERVVDLKVMSRARPADKQRLVEMLQKHGEVVAVTGDGTNDAPALNHAHVGLSLGSGTSVAKQASDITLLDDSFHSIAGAVMWGRSLYKNIQRFLFFQLVVNLTALLLVLGGAIIGTEMPLTVTQILWVNLIMDTFAALALASLPPSREVMAEEPRKQTDFIISKPMAKGILLCSMLFFACSLVLLFWCKNSGTAGIDIHELTIFFTVFVMLQLWNLFNAKSFGSNHSAFHRIYADRGMLLVLLLILVGQWLIVSFGGKMFRTVPLTWQEWGMIIAVTSLVLWIGELYRLLRNQF